MKSSKALYFAALIPPPPVKEEVLRLKLEIKEKFGAAHALKLPAHITLLPPFWLEQKEEVQLLEALSRLTQKEQPFGIKLKDLGHFGQRVIFLKVLDHEPVKILHQQLVAGVAKFLPEKRETSLHPHMTLATRDLTREKFKSTWSEFGSRSYENSFTADSLSLLRHDGKSWDVIREFPFQKEN